MMNRGDTTLAFYIEFNEKIIILCQPKMKTEIHYLINNHSIVPEILFGSLPLQILQFEYCSSNIEKTIHKVRFFA